MAQAARRASSARGVWRFPGAKWEQPKGVLHQPHDNESAIVAILVPGNYTAILRGKNGGTGVALVEAYDLK